MGFDSIQAGGRCDWSDMVCVEMTGNPMKKLSLKNAIHVFQVISAKNAVDPQNSLFLTVLTFIQRASF